MVKPETTQLVLSIAVRRHCNLRQIDISNALLHKDLQESVLMHQPPGFEDKNHPGYVCKFNGAIYGLKQSPMAWFARLSKRISQLGFQPSRADASLFVLHSPEVTIYMLVYADDIVIAGSNAVSIDCVIKSLSETFSVKDLGRLSYFLGITIQGITLTQQKYASDLLLQADMENWKPTSTPMSTLDKLSKHWDNLSTAMKQ